MPSELCNYGTAKRYMSTVDWLVEERDAILSKIDGVYEYLNRLYEDVKKIYELILDAALDEFHYVLKNLYLKYKLDFLYVEYSDFHKTLLVYDNKEERRVGWFYFEYRSYKSILRLNFVIHSDVAYIDFIRFYANLNSIVFQAQISSATKALIEKFSEYLNDNKYLIFMNATVNILPYILYAHFKKNFEYPVLFEKC